jgi:hypothetical protein
MALRKLAILALVALLALPAAFAASPIATPNYDEVKDALVNFSTVMERLSKEVPNIKTAADTANELNLFASANEKLATALSDFVRDNPEIAKQKDPPPQLATLWTNLGQLRGRYDQTVHDLGFQAQKYGGDPTVKAAVERMAKSAIAVNSVGR